MSVRKAGLLIILAGLTVAAMSGLVGGSLTGAISGVALTVTGGALFGQSSKPQVPGEDQ